VHLRAEKIGALSDPVRELMSQDGVDIELLRNIELDRTDDHVYSSTTAVISSVMNMTQTATEKNVHLYVPLVKVPYTTNAPCV